MQVKFEQNRMVMMVKLHEIWSFLTKKSGF